MTGTYRGKRLFSGRLFAGRLFGPAQGAVIGAGGRRVAVPRSRLADPRARQIEEDDSLLLLASALCAAAGLTQ